MVADRRSDVSILAVDERPDFVGLNAAARQVPQDRILILGAGRSGLFKRMIVPFAAPVIRFVAWMEAPSTRQVRTAARFSGDSLFMLDNVC